MIEVSLDQARLFVLEAQGLRTRRPCKSILDVAKRVHNIQIDTISVVSRSHNLIVFNRWPEYEEGAVWKDQRGKDLLEWWSHGICLMPMDVYPFVAWRVQFYPDQLWGSLRKWGEKEKRLIEEVYNHVKIEGPTGSASLGTRKTRSSGWWDWKAEKRALEFLFYTGRLLVAYREGFQKYYDLTERVLPPDIETEPMSDDEAAEFVTTTTISALGLASQRDLRTYMGRYPARKLWSGNKPRIEEYLEHLERESVLEEVFISGVDERYFVLKDDASQLSSTHVSADDVPVKLLSPFDNIIRERHFPADLWGFDYRLESYTPAEKREYGYYVLPLLDQHLLVGRVDAKINRAERRLELKALFLESDFWRVPAGLERLASGMEIFARFHQAETIELGRVQPSSARGKVLRELAQ